MMLVSQTETINRARAWFSDDVGVTDTGGCIIAASPVANRRDEIPTRRTYQTGALGSAMRWGHLLKTLIISAVKANSRLVVS
jgi:hypothetical protein